MSKSYNIYFEDRKLIITKKLRKDSFSQGELLYNFRNSEQLLEIVRFFDSSSFFNKIYVIDDHPKKLLKSLKKEFKYIEAAGGIVRNSKDEILLIYRRGRWDLPKGKREKGETPEETAVREISEECGISAPEITAKDKSTYHTYWMKNSLVLKKTFWYKMDYFGDETPVPQTEEDIIDIAWVPPSELFKVFGRSYASIEEVLQRYRTKTK
jgi:8-oxo-dGTP pyrophosphatase MutT (NUDIX family)